MRASGRRARAARAGARQLGRTRPRVCGASGRASRASFAGLTRPLHRVRVRTGRLEAAAEVRRGVLLQVHDAKVLLAAPLPRQVQCILLQDELRACGGRAWGGTRRTAPGGAPAGLSAIDTDPRGRRGAPQRPQILVLFACLGVAFARNPLGLIAIAMMMFSILLLNNKFAEAAGVAIAKAAKNVSPQLAATVRARGPDARRAAAPTGPAD